MGAWLSLPIVNQGLVSVIIPTYGRPAFLAEAVDSVLQQSYPQFEVLVIDDGWPEPVRLAVSDPRVTLLRHERNLGPAAARNTGLRHARGEFVAFLDDDDRFTPDRLERGIHEIGDARIHLVRRTDVDRTFDGDLRARFTHSHPPSILQALLRLDDAEMFDPSLRVSEDIDWWLRMRDRAVFRWSDEVGVLIRLHDGPRPGVDPTIRMKCREAVALRHLPALDRRGGSVQLRRVASAALSAGSRRSTATYATRSLLRRPSILGFKLLARSVAPSRTPPAPHG